MRNMSTLKIGKHTCVADACSFLSFVLPVFFFIFVIISES